MASDMNLLQRLDARIALNDEERMLLAAGEFGNELLQRFQHDVSNPSGLWGPIARQLAKSPARERRVCRPRGLNRHARRERVVDDAETVPVLEFPGRHARRLVKKVRGAADDRGDVTDLADPVLRRRVLVDAVVVPE